MVFDCIFTKRGASATENDEQWITYVNGHRRWPDIRGAKFVTTERIGADGRCQLKTRGRPRGDLQPYRPTEACPCHRRRRARIRLCIHMKGQLGECTLLVRLVYSRTHMEGGKQQRGQVEIRVQEALQSNPRQLARHDQSTVAGRIAPPNGRHVQSPDALHLQSWLPLLVPPCF